MIELNLDETPISMETFYDHDERTCPDCGVLDGCLCGACERCDGSGMAVLTELEWGYHGSDYAPCPDCGGSGESPALLRALRLAREQGIDEGGCCDE